MLRGFIVRKQNPVWARVALTGSALLLTFFASFPATAEPLALGAFYLWEDKPYVGFQSGAKYEVLPYISYDDERFFFRGLEGGIRLFDQSNVGISFVGRYNTMGYEAGDSPDLVGMADREHSIELGGLVRWRPGNLGVRGFAVVDVTGEHDGYEAGAEVTLSGESRGWEAFYRLGSSYMSEDMVDYYFGVRPGEAIPMTRPAYMADAEFVGFASIDLVYHMNLPLDIWLRMDYAWFGTEIQNSPIVGSDTQFTGMIGLGYRFDFWDKDKQDTGTYRR